MTCFRCGREQGKKSLSDKMSFRGTKYPQRSWYNVVYSPSCLYRECDRSVWLTKSTLLRNMLTGTFAVGTTYNCACYPENSLMTKLFNSWVFPTHWRWLQWNDTQSQSDDLLVGWKLNRCAMSAVHRSENTMGVLSTCAFNGEDMHPFIHCSDEEGSIRLLWPDMITAACMLMDYLSNHIDECNCKGFYRETKSRKYFVL